MPVVLALLPDRAAVGTRGLIGRVQALAGGDLDTAIAEFFGERLFRFPEYARANGGVSAERRRRDDLETRNEKKPPDPIRSARIDDGAELGPVMDDLLDTTGVARRGGAAGALTAGRVDRADALSTAVAGALGPFVSGLY